MCAGPFEAATPGTLPADGPATVGGVELPAGRVVADGRFWITDEDVSSAYVMWADLAAVFPETGLWPVLWTLPQYDRLERPTKPGTVERGEELIRSEWDDFVSGFDDDVDELDEFFGTYSPEFPGLTPAQHECRYNAVDRARTVSGSDLIALVPVRRPADVPAVVGWNDTRLDSGGDISAVLRSWEDRLGAYLDGLAPGGLFLTIERPPQTDQGRIQWAVEQLAFNHAGFVTETFAGHLTVVTKFESNTGFSWD